MRTVKPLAIVAALVRFYFRVLPSGWYRRFPFVPIPPAKYVRWRFQTAYGQHRPPVRVLLADLWQFGGWLADSDRP
jgi:hypothetical protein